MLLCMEIVRLHKELIIIYVFIAFGVYKKIVVKGHDKELDEF